MSSRNTPILINDSLSIKIYSKEKLFLNILGDSSITIKYKKYSPPKTNIETTQMCLESGEVNYIKVYFDKEEKTFFIIKVDSVTAKEDFIRYNI